MWRAFFLAIGVSLCLLGGECLLIHKAVLAAPAGEAPMAALGPMNPMSAPPARRELKPPEWAPWSLMSAGAVVSLYSFTIPRRIAG